MSKAMMSPQRFSRMDRSFLGAWWWTVDRSILIAVFLLSLFGLALISTASPSVAQGLEQEDYFFFKRQLLWLGPAFMTMIALSMLSARSIWRISTIVMLLSIFALILTLFFGTEIKGSRRWLSVIGFSFQPSEFIKPAFVVVAAWLMAFQKTDWHRIGSHRSEKTATGRFLIKARSDIQSYYVVVGLYAFIIMLLMMQPDLGMSVVVTGVFAAQIFLAGLRLRYMALMLIVGPVMLAGAYFSFPHVQSRMDRFFFPESGDNYQVEQSLTAFQTGGITGVGLGQGEVKMRLPDAHADFIFSVAGEEFGLVFVMALIGVFLFIILRGLSNLMQSGQMFSILAVGGLLTMFGLQALIHMGSAVNILPAKGMTMPFISYGGSSLLSLGISMGIILALTRRQGTRRSMILFKTTPEARTDSEE